MRWIKHPSAFSRSAAMTDVLETLGPAGYGATWLLLERIAGEWDGKTKPELQLSIKSWKDTCKFSFKKLQHLLKILENHGIIYPKQDENKLTLTAPILLELLDEWTSRNRKNSGDPPETLPSDSRIQTEQQSEVYKEQNKTQPPPGNLRRSLMPVLKRHGIQPDSDRGRQIIWYIEQKLPNNPGGYLEAIFKENPGFSPPIGEAYRRSASDDGAGGPVLMADILHDMGYTKKRSG